jgi:hypothetical protein
MGRRFQCHHPMECLSPAQWGFAYVVHTPLVRRAQSSTIITFSVYIHHIMPCGSKILCIQQMISHVFLYTRNTYMVQTDSPLRPYWCCRYECKCGPIDHNGVTLVVTPDLCSQKLKLDKKGKWVPNNCSHSIPYVS